MFTKLRLFLLLPVFFVFVALLFPQVSKAQFSGNLGTVSGVLKWGAGTLNTTANARVKFVGNTTGFSATFNLGSGTSYNTGASLPADTYVATLSIIDQNNLNPYVVGTQTVSVTAGQTTTADFDLSTTSSLVQGNLKINGVESEGMIQFCNASALGSL